MSGEQVEIQWCQDIALELGSVTIAHSVIGVFDLAAVLPPELPKLDGVLSLKSFGGRIVTIDLAGDRIVLESVASAAARRATMDPLLVRAATGDDGSSLTLFVAVHAQPAPVWFLMDSGNLVGTILSPHAVQQVLPEGSGLEEASVVTDTVELQLVGMSRRSEPVIVRDVIYDGVLGASFFLERALMFDLREDEPWVGSQRPIASR
jgi:hypothetical protein